jgi:hypothetical protein
MLLIRLELGFAAYRRKTSCTCVMLQPIYYAKLTTIPY